MFKPFLPLAALIACLPQSAAASPASRSTMKFDRIAATLPDGQVFARGKVGLLCVPYETHTWSTGRDNLQLSAFAEVFHKEALSAGLPVAGDPTSLFGDSGYADSDLLVGASIYQMQVDACAPWAANLNSVKGSAVVGVEWQIFSKRQRALIYRVRTTGDFREKKATQGGLYNLVFGAFRANVRSLAADPGLQAALRSQL